MAFASWVPFTPIQMYLSCMPVLQYNCTDLWNFTWKRRVNLLFSALVLKPAHGITLLTTYSGFCSLKLTTQRSSWLLQNSSHLFFQEICEVCGRLPKSRHIGLTFYLHLWLAAPLFVQLRYSSRYKPWWVLESIDTGISLARKELNKLDPSWLCVSWWDQETHHWFFFFFFTKDWI